MSNSQSQLNILIIDDDPIARMLARRNIEIAGFEGSIITAENGEMGFDLIQNSDQEYVVLLDFHMPELDGLGLLRKLKHHNLQPPIFMLSSSLLAENKQDCLNHPCVQEYMVKPIDQEKTKIILSYVDSKVNSY